MMTENIEIIFKNPPIPIKHESPIVKNNLRNIISSCAETSQVPLKNLPLQKQALVLHHIACVVCVTGETIEFFQMQIYQKCQ